MMGNPMTQSFEFTTSTQVMNDFVKLQALLYVILYQEVAFMAGFDLTLLC